MHNGVDVLSPQDVPHKVGASDVSLDTLKIGRIADGVEVTQRGAVFERVVDDDLFCAFMVRNGRACVMYDERTRRNPCIWKRLLRFSAFSP